MKRAGIYHRPNEEPIDRDYPRMELAYSTPENVFKFVHKHQGEIFDTSEMSEIFLVNDRRETLVFIRYNDVTIVVPHNGLRTARQYVRRYTEIA